jgi:hypothetical protein
VPGLEGSLAWKQPDAWFEAVCVREGNEHTPTASSTPGARWGGGRSRGCGSGWTANSPNVTHG